MDNKGKEGSYTSMILIMVASLVIAGLWESLDFIKNSIHAILDPSVGAVLNWEVTWGLLLVIFILTIIMTLVQKYTTDQDTLKEMRKEQKVLQEEMKQYRDDPKKMMELQKKSFEFIPKTMKLSMRAIVYTSIPLILLFRWFMDYFSAIPDFRFLGFFTWFWFYLLSYMIFSGIIRKVLKVV
jgi:uncharacterized membrane protein (DUF106 family)